MNPEEKEDVDRITKVFYKIKKDKKLSVQEVDDLVTDLSRLIGIYSIDKATSIAVLIEEMLLFGEENNLAVQGLRMEFEDIKKGKFKPRLR